MNALNIRVADRKYGPRLVGSWGEFISPEPENRILYLSTTVKFSKDMMIDDDLNAIRHLRPVREVLEVDKLKFKELLQRDIDDHRVAHEMVPYILGEFNSKEATFFPPILAIFLPNAAKDGDAQIPRITENPEVHNGSNWLVTESDLLFRLKRFSNEQGVTNSDIPLAELEWNSQKAKLVVIDGQHRLMAMLAIHRTHHNEWRDGLTYKRIYEDSVRNSIARVGFLRDLEFPVTILVFPELSGEKTTKLYSAARKIFLDVNKGAKSPTQSRLILLSDSDITNIFVRELLETIRTEDQSDSVTGKPDESTADVPLLPAIQYDASSHDDEKDKPRVTRFLTLVTLRELSNYLAFYPPRFQKSMVIMRERRRVETFENFCEALSIRDLIGPNPEFEEEGEEKEVSLADLDIDTCPAPIVARLTEIYLDRIGILLSTLFRTVEPYASHLCALNNIRNLRLLDGEDGALVKEAIFAGSGTAFILERIQEEYRNSRGGVPTAQAAWEKLDEAQEAFLNGFAARLFPSESTATSQRQLLSGLTEQTRSRACLLGLTMASALFLHRIESKFGRIRKKDELATVVEIFAKAVNDYLTDKTLTRSGCHKSALFSKQPLPRDKRPSVQAFNKIPSLSPDNWVEFRCMWWEVLMKSSSGVITMLKEQLYNSASQSKFSDLENALLSDLDEARTHLLEEWIRVKKKDVEEDNPDYSDQQLLRAAQKRALKDYFETYQEWFGMTENQFGKAFKASKNGQGAWKLD